MRPTTICPGACWMPSPRAGTRLSPPWQGTWPHAQGDIDTVNRAIDFLRYHGELSVLVDVMRIGWPSVKSSDKIVPWGISRFAQSGVDHEIFDYLEHTDSPDPTDAVFLDRVHYFVKEPREEYLREFIDDLTGKSAREWRANDFALIPPRKRSRDEWDDESEEEPAPDQGATNLSRLISEFVGYLRREEGVPFPRGEMVREELYRYFLRRNNGDLDPRPSMLEMVMKPNLKLPKPPRPAHPLCPERVTLEAHLAGLMEMMSGRYHSAAALFQAMPAWLRFLESEDSSMPAFVTKWWRSWFPCTPRCCGSGRGTSKIRTCSARRKSGPARCDEEQDRDLCKTQKGKREKQRIASPF